ncbi:MAG: 8-oxo-dGTP diphosphatase [Infirmifilum sp.]
MAVKATLTFVINEGRILLIRKKEGFGAGKINGVGGKIEYGENPEEAAAREVFEEVGIRVYDLIHTGTLYFYTADSNPTWIVEIYVTFHFQGTPVETREATPMWFNIKSLPFEEMWEDDRHWLPHVLAGRKVEGHFRFNEDYTVLKQYRLVIT